MPNCPIPNGCKDIDMCQMSNQYKDKPHERRELAVSRSPFSVLEEVHCVVAACWCSGYCYALGAVQR